MAGSILLKTAHEHLGKKKTKQHTDSTKTFLTPSLKCNTKKLPEQTKTPTYTSGLFTSYLMSSKTHLHDCYNKNELSSFPVYFPAIKNSAINHFLPAESLFISSVLGLIYHSDQCNFSIPSAVPFSSRQTACMILG